MIQMCSLSGKTSYEVLLHVLVFIFMYVHADISWMTE
jgi:hypothetical protein